MLSITKKITFSGSSLINKVVAETFSADINSDNPENMSLSTFISNANLYKENQELCDADEKAFRAKVFEEQAELLAEKAME